jgi:hypothetical protein
MDNLVADALSMKVYLQDSLMAKKGAIIDTVSYIHAITIIITTWYGKISKFYENDPQLRDIMAKKLLYANSWPEFTLVDGVLKYKNMVVIGSNEELKKRLVDATHDSCVEGHTCIQNSYKRLKSYFYWPSIKQMVKQVVEEYDTCKRAKLERVAYPGLLQPFPLLEGIWKNITMDFIEALPKSGGMSTIMVIVNIFTKYAYFIGLTHSFLA